MPKKETFKVTDALKVNRKTFFNPSGWVGYESIKAQTQGVWVSLKGIFFPPKAGRQETFEQAQNRLHLSEADIQSKAAAFLNYSYAFILLAICTFIVSFFYLFTYHTFAGWLLGLAVATLFASQAFRFHFWYFQMKHRKLGCTFEEWKRGKPFENDEPKA